MSHPPENIEGYPCISGFEDDLERVIHEADHHYSVPVDSQFKSAFACALHMHQPLIPASHEELHSAEVISNLQHMMEHQGIGDNHNAPVFKQCYKRMGEIIPKLIDEGCRPKIMLEYTGSLFYGLRKMEAHDVIETLQNVTQSEHCEGAVEWLGAPWGHPVAPSTPVQDYRLHVKAWQQHFASIFGWDALKRVVGFSPSEMALPNHPDIAYEFIHTLRECGYQYIIVQEHTVEDPESGASPENKYIPHRLVCADSSGEEIDMIAIIKTQGSDTKLVAQMQPYYEAKSMGLCELAGQQVPPLSFQIADGENGGVMMNEFPPKYEEAVRECSNSETPMLNGRDYLAYLHSRGIDKNQFPVIQPAHQKKIWDRFKPGDGAEKLEQTISDLKKDDHQFNMDGGSWTNDISWVQGYDNILGPMEKASSLFYEKVVSAGVPPTDPRFRKALFYLLNSQTSCFRYWGQGTWVEYGKELCRRTEEVIRAEF